MINADKEDSWMILSRGREGGSQQIKEDQNPWTCLYIFGVWKTPGIYYFFELDKVQIKA